ncbi:MAG TPA: transposase zinc-binding domain-containing protein [Niabella sp.]|nr:transposase zinc-binding domain-containing protein [Niabella sp.]HRB87087.1 transposase zinc-binding domain-containing protein [Bacteroidia bacterium]HQX21577.1 transposase zinc-binding domain-containing protein [Niabella sp.]HQX42769.1 transposase zinc-binding domain-containing protein [Niabella sp.]HRB37197.1 transposase zinc-binding domain-containing protein [Niabella sp.]
MDQPLAEIRWLLQSKIFSHPSVRGFNSYSQAVLSRLSRCHTSGIGVHQYRCSNEGCGHIHYQYHSCGNLPRYKFSQNTFNRFLRKRFPIPVFKYFSLAMVSFSFLHASL